MESRRWRGDDEAERWGCPKTEIIFASPSLEYLTFHCFIVLQLKGSYRMKFESINYKNVILSLVWAYPK